MDSWKDRAAMLCYQAGKRLIHAAAKLSGTKIEVIAPLRFYRRKKW